MFDSLQHGVYNYESTSSTNASTVEKNTFLYKLFFTDFHQPQIRSTEILKNENVMANGSRVSTDYKSES